MNRLHVFHCPLCMEVMIIDYKDIFPIDACEHYFRHKDRTKEFTDKINQTHMYYQDLLRNKTLLLTEKDIEINELKDKLEESVKEVFQNGGYKD